MASIFALGSVKHLHTPRNQNLSKRKEKLKIQEGKHIGAVTHVLINDPTTGYGIFIENMLHKENRGICAPVLSFYSAFKLSSKQMPDRLPPSQDHQLPKCHR